MNLGGTPRSLDPLILKRDNCWIMWPSDEYWKYKKYKEKQLSALAAVIETREASK